MALAKRIIPCLDCDLGIPGGRVVKGREFKRPVHAGLPWEMAARYSRQGADEIVFLDITASADRRATMAGVVRRTAEEVFVPLTVGGGVRRLEDARRLFKAGADKVSVNTGAIERPGVLTEISRRYGSQACVLAIDARRRRVRSRTEARGRTVVPTEEGPCWFEASTHGGRRFTGLDAVAWAAEGVARGAGEVLLTSMDRDGTREGYDLALTRAVAERVPVPVVASGGCGTPAHAVEVLRRVGASAALLAGILHFGRADLAAFKRAVGRAGVLVRGV
ncbi:MAG: imidazole glycerol phosphate synthase subunit HisF [Halobacteria archaeon]